MIGSGNIIQSNILEAILKIPSQNFLTSGHCHQMWIYVPLSGQPRKQRSEQFAENFANLLGTRYQRESTLYDVSIADTFIDEELVLDQMLAQVSLLILHYRSNSHLAI